MASGFTAAQTGRTHDRTDVQMVKAGINYKFEAGTLQSSCPLYPESGHLRCKMKCQLWAISGD
jgi:hypothetical protein